MLHLTAAYLDIRTMSLGEWYPAPRQSETAPPSDAATYAKEHTQQCERNGVNGKDTTWCGMSCRLVPGWAGVGRARACAGWLSWRGRRCSSSRPRGTTCAISRHERGIRPGMGQSGRSSSTTQTTKRKRNKARNGTKIQTSGETLGGKNRAFKCVHSASHGCRNGRRASGGRTDLEVGVARGV